MRTLFLAWQDPSSRQWFPIGRLTAEGEIYRFVYIRGALEAEKKAAFAGLLAFPDLEKVYESDELFPLFVNRVLPRSRPEYEQFVQWLDLPKNEADPLALLGRSGGRRATDSLEVFPLPEPDEKGDYHIHYFVHGLGHLPHASIERIAALRVGEQLFPMPDPQNARDPGALALRTGTAAGDRDRHLVGYCPRYLAPDLLRISESIWRSVMISVERLNPAPAPLQLRLLCNFSARWPAGFEPFTDEDFHPLPRGVLSAQAA